MRRVLALAGVAGIAIGLAPLTTTPASACDPNRPPYCMTVCNTVPPAYQRVYRAAGGYEGPLSSWSELNLGVCGS